MDHHIVAAVSIAGTYSLVFGIGYGLGLGLIFGVFAGVATGITLSIELNRAARGLDHYSLPWEALFSAIRAFAFGAGLYRSLGLEFAVTFAVLVTLGQVFAYSRGMRPAMEYIAFRRARLTRRQFWGTVVRTIGYIVTALICSALVRRVDHAWAFAIRVGLVTGLVTGFGATINPFIEYYADNLPERRLGAFGIGLILCGFTLQSLQYWLALFDVRPT
jgi:hypothetical protein